MNGETIPDLDKILEFAVDVDACEVLLLPELRSGSIALSQDELNRIRAWVLHNVGSGLIRMSDIGARALGLNFLQVDENEATRDYMHIDANGHLRLHSHGATGVPIKSTGLLKAISAIRAQETTE
jgi:hypothetical protein